MSMTCPNCGVVDPDQWTGTPQVNGHTEACLKGEIIGHSECVRAAPRKEQERLVRLLNRLAAGEDVGSEYQQTFLKMHSDYKISMRGDRNINWTHEMDVALIKSFMGDMHNFFVFCRRYDIWVDEAFARHKYLKKREDYKNLQKEAQFIFDKQRSERKVNATIVDEIIKKGTPAFDVDKEWLANNEW